MLNATFSAMAENVAFGINLFLGV